MIYFLYLLLLLLILSVGAEMILRVRGVKPWKFIPPDLKINPEGGFYTLHADRGYSHPPGNYDIQYMNRFKFRVTHDENGFRITGDKTGQNNISSGNEIWIFGCSYTHGWLLNDDETYPWLLQEKINVYKIRNFGGDGYGTLQSLLQFNEALSKGVKPAWVIVAYASFHNQRNVFSRSWKKMLGTSNRLGPVKVPYGALDKKGNLVIKKTKLKYHPFPLARYSALVYFLERRFNTLLDEQYYKADQVTEKIMAEFQRICNENGIRFIVARICSAKATGEMVERFKKMGLDTVDISLPKGKANPEHSFYPHDPHPSPLANKKYADKLYEYLITEINNTQKLNKYFLSSNQQGTTL